jgi:hypothetical protein
MFFSIANLQEEEEEEEKTDIYVVLVVVAFSNVYSFQQKEHSISFSNVFPLLDFFSSQTHIFLICH